MPIRKKYDQKSESTKSNYLQNFSARDEEILRRKLAGERNKSIAKDMELTENRVSFIVNSPNFQARQTSEQEIINKKFKEELATDPVKRKFQQHKEEAANKIITLMKEAQSQKLQRESAIDVLEFQGYSRKPAEDHSTKIFIDESIRNDIYVAIKALNIDTDLLKEIDVEGVVEKVESASRNKSESTGGTGKKKLLGILQGDSEE